MAWYGKGFNDGDDAPIFIPEGKEFELKFCETCIQMTNHIDNKCQKCKARKEREK